MPFNLHNSRWEPPSIPEVWAACRTWWGQWGCWGRGTWRRSRTGWSAPPPSWWWPGARWQVTRGTGVDQTILTWIMFTLEAGASFIFWARTLTRCLAGRRFSRTSRKLEFPCRTIYSSQEALATIAFALIIHRRRLPPSEWASWLWIKKLWRPRRFHTPAL